MEGLSRISKGRLFHSLGPASNWKLMQVLKDVSNVGKYTRG